ncbi:hypothetical protein PJL18_02188 [Paenarthrobacter nicotinovorans]|nr:hypothetical protein [Paenarthrobacter nicotinovorans]
MQRRGVSGGTADDHGNVEFVDELLQVQWLVVLGDVLGGDRGATDDKDVHTGGEDGLVVLLGALRRQGACHRDAGGADLGKATGNEFRLDGCLVEILHAPGNGRAGGFAGER